MFGDLAEMLHSVTHHPWFVVLDLTFHVVVFGHVVAHVCRMGKRLHQFVARVWQHDHR